MPRPIWIARSAWIKCRSRVNTACASIALPKYFSRIAPRLSSTCARSAPPTSTPLPVTVSCIAQPFLLSDRRDANSGDWEWSRRGQAARSLNQRLHDEKLFAPPLHRRGNAHRFAVFRDGAAGDIDALLLQQLDDLLVRQGAFGRFGIDQALDAETDRLGRMRLAATRGSDCRGKK